MPDAPFLEEVNRCIGEARETLGDALFEAAWETGSRMSLDEALQYALDYDRSPIAPDGLPAPERDPGPLTPREAEIASLVGRGLTNRQIGGELGLSVRTVDTHVGRILKKLGLSSRSAVASWASARGEPR